MHQLSAFLPAASGVIPYAAVLATKLLLSIAVLKESQKKRFMDYSVQDFQPSTV